MRARPYHIVALVTCLSGCAAHSDPTSKDPAACVAAYGYLFDVGEGTPLASDPHHAELKIRILFELEKLQKTEGLAEGQRRAADIARQLRTDSQLAYSLAAHCTAEEALTGDFDRARPRLQTIVDSQR